MNKEEFLEYDDNKNDSSIINEFLKYFAFWPYFLAFTVFCLLITTIYLRYAQYEYEFVSTIEILDDSQDSEMSLPTAMTIFNRSMVNLENEMGILNSYRLNEMVVDNLNLNFKFFTSGIINDIERHPYEFIEDYELEFKKEISDTVSSPITFNLKLDKNSMFITSIDADNNILNEYEFNELDTRSSSSHLLPFELKINKYDSEIKNYTIKLFPKVYIVNQFRKKLVTTPTGKDSDHIKLSLQHNNIMIGNEYLDNLVYQFDSDGISDRRDEYKRTLDFVDSRSSFLVDELSEVEIKKQSFKENNNLIDIKSDTELNITQKYNYDSELFVAESQKKLALLLKNDIKRDKFELVPVNIGIENDNINSLITEYNTSIQQRERLLLNAGPNNSIIINLENAINDNFNNVIVSIDNYLNMIDLKIQNIQSKENEFEKKFSRIPENEKILRSIERELEVKEALFLLLLQKREEAAINYAVVKPTIKIIDSSMNSLYPVKPNPLFLYLIALFVSLSLPFIILYIYFVTDNKIHTRSQLKSQLENISIIGEIPFINNTERINSFLLTKSRDQLSESFRMAISNLKFTWFGPGHDEKSKVVLVTSSVKGEGKTLISVNVATVLSETKKKVILVGSDLRNPQIHKYLKVDKSTKGLSDYIFNNTLDYRDLIIKKDSVDILISGSIPPNPTELLSSKKFQSLIEELKNNYDYVIIDSAPCLLVSDTLEISKFRNLIDSTIYVVRANYTDNSLMSFIRELKDDNKLINLNLILNSVGKSSKYGYKYNYQYGYGYQYGYNYGYGYGYGIDK